MFKKEERSVDEMFHIIVDMVRLKLMGLKIKYSFETEKAACIWNLPLKEIRKGVVKEMVWLAIVGKITMMGLMVSHNILSYYILHMVLIGHE